MKNGLHKVVKAHLLKKTLYSVAPVCCCSVLQPDFLEPGHVYDLEDDQSRVASGQSAAVTGQTRLARGAGGSGTPLQDTEDEYRGVPGRRQGQPA